VFFASLTVIKKLKRIDYKVIILLKRFIRRLKVRMNLKKIASFFMHKSLKMKI